MKLTMRIAAVAPAIVAWLVLAPAAWSAETLTVDAGFTPDQLGAATNLSATATFGSTTAGPQSPVVAVTVYGPAGMSIDTRGAGTCRATPAMLLEAGPGACPASSRIGFGNGVGLFEIAGEIIKGRFTLEFFLAPAAHGDFAILIYFNASTPVADQKVLVAREVRGAAPYGVGISFDVPVTRSLPGASLGWQEHVSLSLGAQRIAYYRTLRGRRKLVHVRGIVLPERCPPGGFPIESEVGFADGTTARAKTATPCPRR